MNLQGESGAATYRRALHILVGYAIKIQMCVTRNMHRLLLD